LEIVIKHSLFCRW